MANRVADGRIIETRGTNFVVLRVPGITTEVTYSSLTAGVITADMPPGATTLAVYDDNTVVRHEPRTSAASTK